MVKELNRDAIATLVKDFYTDIRRDRVPGPVFEGAIGVDRVPPPACNTVISLASK